MSFEYLDVDTVIEFNQRYGGLGAGVIDRRGLEASLARSWSGFGEAEFYPTIWDKAGVLLHGLATTQSFSDGNKRTAWVTAATFLRLNGEDLMAVDPGEGERFVLDVVGGNHGPSDVAEWLFDHAEPLTEALDDHGECDFCGRIGDLPGAELLPRSIMRRSGYTAADQIYESAELGGDSDFGVRRFNPSRDLLPGVCGRCRSGWMSLVDRAGVPVLAALLELPDWTLSDSDRRNIACWAVKFALLRSTLEPFALGSWRTRQSRRLRQERRVPAGWAVLAVHSQLGYATTGNFTHLSGRPDGAPPTAELDVRVAQCVVPIGALTLLIGYSSSEHGIAPYAQRFDDVRSAIGQLWPPDVALAKPSVVSDETLDDLGLRLSRELHHGPESP
ncbi:prophage maintenance system killer protein [Marmoricola sp. URHA0025 HA25]